MSLKNVTTPETNVREIEFTVDKATFDAAVFRAYKARVGKISVPGFRRGKAPLSIIEKMYGSDFFHSDAFNDLLPELYESALKESGVDAVSRPDIGEPEFSDEVITFKARVYVKPEVEVSAYRGIAAEKQLRAVTDEDVSAEIDRVRERNARTVEITNRPAQTGDNVTIDYAGTVDGVAFEGGTAQEQQLKLGSGRFIPGFEEQICGHKTGDEFDVNVTFPEDYSSDELKGKAAVFACKLHKIEFDELPALDDEFAKDVSEFNTLAEYKADVRAKIEQRASHTAEHMLEESIFDKLLENTAVEIPEVMIEAEVSSELRSYENRLMQQGLNMEMYMQYTGMTAEQMREQFKPQAQKQVKLRLALEKVATLEDISVGDEEIEEEYNSIASSYGMEVDKVKESIDPEDLRNDIRVKKAVELIKSSAVITEKTITD